MSACWPPARLESRENQRAVRAGLAIPAVIILGCVLLVALVAFTTRKKRALWDIFPDTVPSPGPVAAPSRPVGLDAGAEPTAPAGGPERDNSAEGDGTRPETAAHPLQEAPAAASGGQPGQPGQEMLAGWHRRYQQTVTDWIENHQQVLGDINASGLQIDLGQRDELLAGHDRLAPKMREAIASHPVPVMRAELSAMHVAGEAAVFAVMRSDYGTARRQHLVYVQYRDEWIERLHQFSNDFSEDQMSHLRAVMNTDEFKLEEIRAALETALGTADEPAQSAPRFETPLLLADCDSTVFELEKQPADTLEAAVGAPEDTTADLEGGRVRRALRHLGSGRHPGGSG